MTYFSYRFVITPTLCVQRHLSSVLCNYSALQKLISFECYPVDGVTRGGTPPVLPSNVTGNKAHKSCHLFFVYRRLSSAGRRILYPRLCSRSTAKRTPSLDTLTTVYQSLTHLTCLKTCDLTASCSTALFQSAGSFLYLFCNSRQFLFSI